MVRQVQHRRLGGSCLIAYFQPVSVAQLIGQVHGQFARKSVFPIRRNVLQGHGAVRLRFQRPHMVCKTRITSVRGHSLTIFLQGIFHAIQRKLCPLDSSHIAAYRSPIVLTETTIVHHIVETYHAVFSLINQTHQTSAIVGDTSLHALFVMDGVQRCMLTFKDS